MVKYLDLGFQYEQIRPGFATDLDEFLLSGQYVLGDIVDRFETKFAKWNGSLHCVGVANGSDALKLALQVLGVGAGDEVIAPAHTFKATIAAIVAVGAVPVLIDADLKTGLIDPNMVVDAISNKTKAFIPVHMHGTPFCLCDLAPILQSLGIVVVEDSSQAHGAQDHGRAVGNRGALGAFSLYPGKNLGAAGDAGVLTTNDGDLASKLKKLRTWIDLENLGKGGLSWNSRLDPIQALLLERKLEHLHTWNSKRVKQAELYAERFSGAIAHLGGVAGAVYHHFPILCEKRDALATHLASKNIETGSHYRQAISASLLAPYCKTPFGTKVADLIAEQTLSLPIGPHLKLEEVEQVADEVLNFV